MGSGWDVGMARCSLSLGRAPGAQDHALPVTLTLHNPPKGS